MIRIVRLTLAAVTLPLTIVACTMANIGPEAAERQTQQAVYSASYDDVYRAAVQQAGELKWQVLYSDKDAGAIRIATPQTWGAWADTVAVSLTESDSGIVVVVRSTLGQSPNRKNVQEYLEGLAVRLSPPSEPPKEYP